MIKKLIVGLLVLVLIVLAVVIAVVAFIDPDDYREQIAQRASETLGREVRLDGPMSLSLFPWLALEIEDVQVGNPPGLADAPPLARIGTALASVRVMPLLRGELETGALTLSGAELTLVTGPAGQTNLEGLLAEPSSTADEPPLDLTGINLGAITLEQVVLVQLDLLSGARTTLAIDRMSLDAFVADQPLDFSLQARLSDASGDLLVIDELNGSMRVARDLSNVTVSGLAADYRLPGGDVVGQASGNFDLQLTAEAALRVDDFKAELKAAGHSLSLSLGDPLSLVMGEALDLALTNASLGIDGQILQANGRVRLDDQLSADLMVSGQELDLRRFTSAPAGDRSGGSTSAETDFSALEALSLAFRLELERLIVTDQLRLSEVVAEASLRNGRLELAPMQAGLFAGQFNGRVDVDFTKTPPTVALQPELSGIAINQLAELSGGAAPLSGLADAQLILDFSGLDLAGILATLNGSGRIEISNGALEGVDLRRLINEELTVNNLSNVSRAFGGQTAFDTLQAQVDVVDGVVEMPDLDLSAAGYGVQGQGRINFAEDRIEYGLQLELGPELTQMLPRSLRDATGGRIPLTIGGPIGQPVVSLDFNSLLESTIRQQLTERFLTPRGDDAESEGNEETDDEATPSDSEAVSETADDPPPRTRERTSQALLRSLLERASESDATEEARAETGEETGERTREQNAEEVEPPPTL